MSDHKFRIRFAIAGGHVHCRLFSAPDRTDPTWAKCGDFCVRKGPEFRDLMVSFKADFVGETSEDGTVAACEP